MQRLFWAVTLAMAHCFGTAFAAEDAKRVTFLEGVYSVEIPTEGWRAGAATRRFR